MSAESREQTFGSGRSSVLISSIALAVCSTATVAVVVALFVAWYGRGFAISSEGGYVIRSVRTQAGDAWSVVPGTAWMILAASLVTLAGLAIGVARRSFISLGLLTSGSLAAFAVTIWRVVDPPTPVVHGFFRLRGFSMPVSGGETAALAATSVASGAAVSLLALAVAQRRAVGAG